MSRRWESLKKTNREKGYIGATGYLASKALRLVRTGKLQPPNTSRREPGALVEI